ncbi:unnamed protein product [Linum tenue]|uniref:Uncharacterized protein n=1 Tax=Linum tenue TaxID=586396 RepID=A0AAV0RNY1_9ROSI|nr:unnamed protein product [Linum tenue]
MKTTQSINILFIFLVLLIVSGNCRGRQLRADNVRVLRFCRAATLKLNSPRECSLEYCERKCAQVAQAYYRPYDFGRCNYSTMKCDCYQRCRPQ